MTSFLPYSKALPVELVEAGFTASEAVNDAITRAGGWWGVRNGWMSIRLTDGYSDGTVFDKRQDMIRHHANKEPYYPLGLKNLAGGAVPREMAVVIKFARDAHRAGFRYVDPDAVASRYQVAMTAGQRDYLRGCIG